MKDPVIQGIGEALDIYGESVKQVVFWNLEKTFGIRKEELLQNPDMFAETIARVFGIGAPSVEKTIVKSLSKILGLTSLESLDLVTVLKKAKNGYGDG